MKGGNMPKSNDDFFIPEDVDTLIWKNPHIKAAKDKMFYNLTNYAPLNANWSDFDACCEEVIPTVLGVMMTRGDCLHLAKQLGSRLLIIDVARDRVWNPDDCPPLSPQMVEAIAAEYGLFDLTPPKFNKHNSSFRFADSAA